MSLDVEAFRANGYAVIRGAVPAALCEALVVAIGEVSGLDADRPETSHGDVSVKGKIHSRMSKTPMAVSASKV